MNGWELSIKHSRGNPDLMKSELARPTSLHEMFYFSTAGGSMSNMYAMNLARFQRWPDIKEQGLSACPRLVLFTSKEVGVLQCPVSVQGSYRCSLCLKVSITFGCSCSDACRERFDIMHVCIFQWSL